MIRYRFSEFTLSPQRRQLVREGQEVPLIPRYFDLLLLLIERRQEAVHRREIFDRLWNDVNVSESALSQAVRTIRRTLGDDSREPRFIRTVSRHGYQFVFPEVIEEEDDGVWPTSSPSSPRSASTTSKTLRGACAGGAFAGVVAGGLGGLILAAAPGSAAPIAMAPVLAVVGGGCGALGGAGVGVGLAFAESASGSYRTLAFIVAAACGGGVVGTTVQWLTRWSLSALVGLNLEFGGGLEGIVIGSAVGAAYALAIHQAADGIRARGRRHLRAALMTASLCGLAGLALTLIGRPLVGGTIHAIADAADGSRATLAPLGRLLGEPDFGPVSSAMLAVGESASFGLGIAFGLLRRSPNA